MASQTESNELRRRGFGALTHPVAVGALIVLVVNDHVLKEAFGSAITGKLSDIAGAIFVPLLVAVVLERYVARSIEIGMAITAIVLGAINLIPAADGLFEACLGVLWPGSTNTLDPTDLVAIPAVGVSYWIWQQATSTRRLRRAWGMVMFTAGVFAVTATGGPVDLTTSESFSGTVLLTRDEPQLVVLVDVQRDGVDADIPSVMQVSELNTTVFGQRTDTDPILIETSGVGQGRVSLSLVDLAAAPVEVGWSMRAVGEETDGEVSLTISAQPDTFAAEPFAVLQAETGPWVDPVWHRATLSLPPGDAALTVRAPGRAIILRDADGVEYQVNGSVQVPRPDRCETGCEVPLTVWVGDDTRFNSLNERSDRRSVEVEFFLGGIETDAVGAFEQLETVAERVVIDAPVPDIGNAREREELAVAIELPGPVNFGDLLDVDIEHDIGPYVNAFPDLQRWRISSLETPPSTEIVVDGRCVRFAIGYQLLPEDDDEPDPEIDSTPLTVTYFSALGGDSSPELRVAVGDAASSLC